MLEVRFVAGLDGHAGRQDGHLLGAADDAERVQADVEDFRSERGCRGVVDVLEVEADEGELQREQLREDAAQRRAEAALQTGERGPAFHGASTRSARRAHARQNESQHAPPAGLAGRHSPRNERPTSHGTPAAVWVAARVTRREVKTWSAAFPMCSAPTT